MDDPHFRQRHPNAPPYPSASPPHPSAPPFPDPPSSSERLYPDLSSASSFAADATAPPPPGFHGFSSQPPRRDGFDAPPPPPHDAPPYERYRYRQHQPPTIWESIRQKLVLVVIGVLLFIGGVGVTFWNEGRTVKRSKVLEDGLARVTTLTPSPRDGRCCGFSPQSLR